MLLIGKETDRWTAHLKRQKERLNYIQTNRWMDGQTDGHTCTIDQQKLKLTLAEYKMKTVINSTKQGPA